MSTQQLLAFDLLAVLLSTAMFFAAGAVTLAARSGSGRGPAVASALCTSIGLLATVGQLLIVLSLVGRGWWFGGEKLLLAVPLAMLTAGLAGFIALPFLLERARGRAPAESGDKRPARAGAALLIAGYGSVAGVFVTFVVGYPVSVPAAMATLGVVVGVSGLTWVTLTGRQSRGLTTGLILLCLVPALSTAALAFYGNLQPAVLGSNTGHGHLAGSAAEAGSAGEAAVSVADLRTAADSDRPVRHFTLVAAQQEITLPSGRSVSAWTFGSLPGPEIRVQQRNLVEVTLQNTDIADGVTLHWHGYPVPNGEDGVAGVTQDAVAPGQSFDYRFEARDTGTYWYHTHQLGSEAVARGLYGTLVVEPAPSNNVDPDPGGDLVLPIHTIEGIPVIAGTDEVIQEQTKPGRPTRLRLINTDSTPHRISISGAPFTVSAVDGTDLNGPTEVADRVLRLPAGGRYDAVVLVDTGASVSVAVEGASNTGVLLTAAAEGPEPRPLFVDAPDLDLLSYGEPSVVPGMTDTPPDRKAELVLDREFRFLGGIPTFAQTINGNVHPFVPSITVSEGQLLRLTVVNRGGDTHPMHPHGHRVLVQSRDGIPVTGSPLWLDTFDVQPGEVWQVLLHADNPGIWMAHCHNLEHATAGMVVHLTYDGIRTPFTLGGGPTENRPE